MKSKLSIAWLLCYISIASVSATIITPALPNIQAQLHLSLGAVEWVISAFLIGYVFGQLIYGPLANAYGRLKALRGGLVVNLLGLLVCLFAGYHENYSLLVLGRLITGLGAAAGLACTFMLINEWLPEESRKTAMAYTILSFALGVGLAVMIGGIITTYWHWQSCFIFLFLHGALMLAGTAVFSETLKHPKPILVGTLLQDYRDALSSTKLVIFSLVVGSCSLVGYCYSAAAPQIAHDYLRISVEAYAYWNLVNIVGMLLGGFSSRELLQRFSPSRVIRFGFIGCILGVLSLISMWKFGSHSSIWFFTTTAMLYLFTSYLFGGGSYIASNAITDKASASSMMSFINMSFATIGVIVMGYLSADPLISFMMILGVVFILMVILLKNTEIFCRK